MALFSHVSSTPLFTLSSKTNFSYKPQLTLFLKKSPSSLLLTRSAAENGAGVVVDSALVEEEKLKKKEEEAQVPNLGSEKKEEEEEEEGGEGLGSNGAALKAKAPCFKDPRWVKGNWDLKQFQKNGSTDWDAVIDAVKFIDVGFELRTTGEQTQGLPSDRCQEMKCPHTAG